VVLDQQREPERGGERQRHEQHGVGGGDAEAAPQQAVAGHQPEVVQPGPRDVAEAVDVEQAHHQRQGRGDRDEQQEAEPVGGEEGEGRRGVGSSSVAQWIGAPS
jgi:hypothetical protein